jgi:predicted DNA-binding transcriptional regulator AlpA
MSELRLLKQSAVLKALGISRTTFFMWRAKYPQVLKPLMLAGTSPRWTEEQLREFTALHNEAYSTRGGRR